MKMLSADKQIEFAKPILETWAKNERAEIFRYHAHADRDDGLYWVTGYAIDGRENSVKWAQNQKHLAQPETKRRASR